MKLRNKRTGEIVTVFNLWLNDYNDNVRMSYYDDKSKPQIYETDSLKSFNLMWEDVPEEPKGYWYYDTIDNCVSFNSIVNEYDKEADQEIGNYFETEEEAEKAVKRLRAWKQLKDKGFRFDGYHISAGEIHFNMEIPKDSLDEIAKNLDICFGGEE